MTEREQQGLDFARSLDESREQVRARRQETRRANKGRAMSSDRMKFLRWLVSAKRRGEFPAAVSCGD